MGRRSIADKLFERHEKKEKGDSTWLVVYDFTRSKPPTKFWDNLSRLQEMTDAGSLVKYSVFMTRDMRGAHAAVDLVKHYKGDVILFKGALQFYASLRKPSQAIYRSRSVDRLSMACKDVNYIKYVRIKL